MIVIPGGIHYHIERHLDEVVECHAMLFALGQRQHAFGFVVTFRLAQLANFGTPPGRLLGLGTIAEILAHELTIDTRGTRVVGVASAFARFPTHIDRCSRE